MDAVAVGRCVGPAGHDAACSRLATGLFSGDRWTPGYKTASDAGGARNLLGTLRPSPRGGMTSVARGGRTDSDFPRERNGFRWPGDRRLVVRDRGIDGVRGPRTHSFAPDFVLALELDVQISQLNCRRCILSVFFDRDKLPSFFLWRLEK